MKVFSAVWWRLLLLSHLIKWTKEVTIRFTCVIVLIISLSVFRLCMCIRKMLVNIREYVFKDLVHCAAVWTRCLGHWREPMGEGHTKTAACYRAFIAALTSASLHTLAAVHTFTKHKSYNLTCLTAARLRGLPYRALPLSPVLIVALFLYVLCKVFTS